MKQGGNWCWSDTMGFPFPEYIQLYPTTRCNQRCSFCFNPEIRPIPDLTFKNALLLLDILTENRIRDIDIMGGEPFLIPWIADFVERGISKGMSLNISTNGSMPGRLEHLGGISPAHFNIGISLEGSTAEKHNRMTGSNNFSSALESINRLLVLSLNPLVKTVLNHETADDIQHIVNLIREMGVRRYYLIHMDLLHNKETVIKNAVHYTAFLKFYEKIRRKNPDIEVHRVHASCFDKHSLPSGVRCAGGVRKLSILPDGSVFPCNLFHHMKGFALGNIFRDRFTDIWSHPRLDLFRRHQENRCQISRCENHASCTGGCPAHGYYLSGDPDVTDIRCMKALNSHPATDNPRL